MKMSQNCPLMIKNVNFQNHLAKNITELSITDFNQPYGDV